MLLSVGTCTVSTERELDRALSAGRLALRRGHFPEASTAAEQGLARTRHLAGSPWTWTFRLFQAELHLTQQHVREAIPLLAEAPPAGDQFIALRGRHVYLHARLLLMEGAFSQALTMLDRARWMVGDTDPTRLDIDALAGQVQFRLGHWAEGEALLDAVLTRAAESGDRYHEAVVLNDLGMGRLIRSRWGDALPWFERVIARSDLAPFDHYVRALTNAGICYARLGQFDSAIAAQRRAVEIRRARGPVLEFAQALGSLGNTYFLQGDSRAGLTHLEEAYAVATEGQLPAQAALWAGNLASAYVALGEWNLAEHYNADARRRKQAIGADVDVHNRLNDAHIAQGRGHADEARRLFGLALADANATPAVKWNAEAGLARVAVSARDTDAAARHFQTALETIEQTRSGLIPTEYRLTFLTKLIDFYQDYVHVLVAGGRIGRALEVAESSRGRVLGERQGVTASTSASLSRFFAVARQSNAVLLSYWLAARRSYLWIVTADSVRIVALPPAREIEMLVREHQRTIESTPWDPAALRGGAGDRLYQLLIAPVVTSWAGTSRIVVVPDGALHRLNFETLPVDGARRHALVEDVEVQVAPSLALLAGSTDRIEASPTLLLVGNPIPREPEFPALRYARAEMAAIARHFSPSQVTTFQSERASPATYFAAAPGRFTMIHFAAHATANTISPLDSAVILSGADTSDRLYARDLASQPLEAELVTVSACRSAGERAYSGEGLIGFAWAFLRAGARRVVAGLWDVDDRSSAVLMDRFYERLAEGDRPANALRQAKLHLIAQGGSHAQPYYWGALQMFTLNP